MADNYVDNETVATRFNKVFDGNKDSELKMRSNRLNNVCGH